MCVNLHQYPLVELTDGKKKVLFNFGVVVENRDFTPFNELEKDWNFAILGYVPSKHPYFNQAVKEYGVKKFLKYTSVPCGICEDCLKAKARGWAFRILKEASRFDDNFFVTLTYDDDHLPTRISKNGVLSNTLIKDEISRFNKSLKKKLHDKKLNSCFRFYGVGEYGSQTHRPHYHVIYFDLPIPDLKFYNYDKSTGSLLFTSEMLDGVWKKGHVIIGAVDIGSACYVARYCDKKLNRSKEEKIILSNFLEPEFNVMSRRPGIGAFYMDKLENDFKNGVYSLFASGQTFSIPIYYSKKLKEVLKDTPYLVDYEKRNELLIKNKFARDLTLSDILTTDLQNYYLKEDAFKKSCKKVRDNIKL